MLEIIQRSSLINSPIDDYVVLDHEQRRKGRLKAVTTAGLEIGFFLDRGKTLQVGSVLTTCCGKAIEIQGAKEELVTASSENWLIFSSACYHLGNRHTMLQIGERWLRFKPDHVLEDLAVRLGLNVNRERAVFEPLEGAYSHSGNTHNH